MDLLETSSARDHTNATETGWQWWGRPDGAGDTSAFPFDLRPDPDSPPARETLTVRLPAPLSARLKRMSRGRPEALDLIFTGGLLALLRRCGGAEEVAAVTSAESSRTSILTR